LKPGLVLAPSAAPRRALASRGVMGLAAVAAIAIAPGFDLVPLVVLAAATLDAVLGGASDLALRLRAPVVAATLLALGLLLVRVTGPDLLGRFAAVGLLTGLAAAAGLYPFVHPFDRGAGPSDSAVAWAGFLGPVLGAVVLLRMGELVPAGSGMYLGSLLLGLGLLNVVWGTVAAWRTQSVPAAWHYSLMSDWGLALCGFGVVVADGRAAAFLLLAGILLGRFPLLVASREVAQVLPGGRPAGLLVAAMLAGITPLGGFAARVLLLRGAAQIYWPLALVLALGMLLWLPGSFRLGRSLGQLAGRRAVGMAALLAVNTVLGIYPLPVLSLAGL
jgi:hypothetical protein